MYATGKDITTVRALADMETLRKFMGLLSDSPRTLGKKIERCMHRLRSSASSALVLMAETSASYAPDARSERQSELSA